NQYYGVDAEGSGGVYAVHRRPHAARCAAAFVASNVSPLKDVIAPDNCGTSARPGTPAQASSNMSQRKTDCAARKPASLHSACPQRTIWPYSHAASRCSGRAAAELMTR